MKKDHYYFQEFDNAPKFEYINLFLQSKERIAEISKLVQQAYVNLFKL